MKRNSFMTLGILFLLLTALTGCAKPVENTIGCFDSGTTDQPYEQALETLLPEYSVDYSDASVVYGLQQGQAMCAFDAQAIPMLENGLAGYWYPQYLASVVIAVDRAQTTVDISGWRDLANIEQTVSFADNGGNERQLIAAVSYGLEGESYATKAALDLLKEIASQNRLVRSSFETPVMICMDYQAASLKEAGADIEIIIPEEGTLCFEVGVLSPYPIDFPPNTDSVICACGLRTIGGEYRGELYPSEGEYERAAHVTDYSRFAEQTQRVNRDLRHTVFLVRMYSSADQIQHQLVVAAFVILVTLWACSVMIRVQDERAKKLVIAAAALSSGWVLLRHIKWQLTVEGLASRMCWYGYYAFQLSLPVIMLMIAWSLDGESHNTKLRLALKHAIIAIQAALLVLVLTNDLHGLVFRMDLSRPGWSSDYAYGPMYYVVFAASALPILISIGIMLKKAWKSPRRSALVIPVIFSALFFTYGLGYVLGIPIAKDSDFAMTIGAFTLLFFEAALRSGLIPVNTNYRRLFMISSLKIQIVGSNGETVISSDSSEPLDYDVWQRVKVSFDKPIPSGDNALIYASPISGGTAVWLDDISEINAMQAEISDSVKRLEAANSLLAKEKESKTKRALAAQKLMLTKSLENEIKGYTDKLSLMIAGIDNCIDKKHETARTALLMCCIKRRCNLFFRAMESDSLPADELAVYIDELADFSGYADVKVVTACEVVGSLPVRQGTLIYDFFYTFLDACAVCGKAHIIEQLLPSNDGVTMKLLPSSFPKGFPDASLSAAVESENGLISIKQIDDSVGVSLQFGKGGAND